MQFNHRNLFNVIMSQFYIAANVRVYDHLRCQSDSVSRYTKVPQSDTVRNDCQAIDYTRCCE